MQPFLPMEIHWASENSNILRGISPSAWHWASMVRGGFVLALIEGLVCSEAYLFSPQAVFLPISQEKKGEQ